MIIDELIREGIERHRAHRPVEAEQFYRQALAINPNHPVALSFLGLIASDAGEHQTAESLVGRATQLAPEGALFWVHMGKVCTSGGKLPQGISAYERAATLRPTDPDIAVCLANALRQARFADRALAVAETAVRNHPTHVSARFERASALRMVGRIGEATVEFERLGDEFPDDIVMQVEAARLWATSARPDSLKQARARMQAIGRQNPAAAESWNMLGDGWWHVGETEEALRCFRKAIAIQPVAAMMHWNLALVLLGHGEFEEGWREYEWRTKVYPTLARQFTQPQWRGEELEGKTVLLHAEGGFGDALQFIRYAPMLERRGATVLLECQPALVRLLARVQGIARVFARGDPLPEFDFQAALQGLPLVFDTRLETIPGPSAYLSADHSGVEKWRRRLSDVPGLKVGINWAGSGRPSAESDTRSRDIANWKPLAQVPGVTLVSLQKGSEASQTARADFPLLDLSAEMDDFADLADVVMNLDLVATVDTSVAHLAGGLGKPVWVQIPVAPDFRWLEGREDSPWYPTMRLFRQQPRESWAEVAERMAAAIRVLKHEL